MRKKDLNEIRVLIRMNKMDALRGVDFVVGQTRFFKIILKFLDLLEDFCE